MKDYLESNRFWQILLIYFPAFLLIVFLLFLSLSFFFGYNLKQKTILPSPVSTINASDYPALKSKFEPIISAKGAIIMDADSKVTIYSKNPDLRFSNASTTKIMTALTALEYFDLNDVLTVKEDFREGAIIGLSAGDQITFENILYGMLLPSGNDAAYAIAENYPGGSEAFVKRMNENAKKWKLFNTEYDDPTGLSDGNYTTCSDLARLAIISHQNEAFSKVVSTKEKLVNDITGQKVFYLENLNKLLGINGVDGIKTGYTEEAGQVLVTSSSNYYNTSSGKEKREVIIVVMGSKDRFLDTQYLLGLISGNLTYLSIHP